MTYDWIHSYFCADLNSCGPLAEVPGGSIIYDASSGTKTTATLNCFYGYLPSNGNNKRECRAESTSWTGESFACIRKYFNKGHCISYYIIF